MNDASARCSYPLQTGSHQHAARTVCCADSASSLDSLLDQHGHQRELVQADALVNDARVRSAQQIVHASVAEAALLQVDGLDAFSQGLALRSHQGWMAVGISAQLHKAAGAAFADLVFVHHATRGIPTHLRTYTMLSYSTTRAL